MTLKDFFASFKNLWGAASAAVTAGPLGLFVAGLMPPWPNESGAAASAVAVFAGIVGLILAFLDSATDAKRKQRAIISLLVAVLLVVVYVAIWSLTFVEIEKVVRGDTIERRYIVGFWSEARAAGMTPTEAIMKHTLESAYSPISLLAARMSLIISMCATVLLASYGFGLNQIASAKPAH